MTNSLLTSPRFDQLVQWRESVDGLEAIDRRVVGRLVRKRLLAGTAGMGPGLNVPVVHQSIAPDGLWPPATLQLSDRGPMSSILI